MNHLTGRVFQTPRKGPAAVFAGDKIISNFEYPTRTPCETVVGGKKLRIYPKEVMTRFPDAQRLREMGVESYIGAPLFDSSGHPMGLLVVMDSKPIANPEMVESLMQMFTFRTSLELERKRLEETIQRLEYYDSTTGLPNQLFFYDLLHKAIQKAERNNESLAVLLIDLDRFNEINDTLGFYRGNRLLREVGKRFDTVGQTGAVARLAGDEFGLILPKASSEEAARFASRILKTLQEPFDIEGIPVQVEAGVGIALYPDEGKNPDNLILRAEIALYTSKKSEKTVDAAKPGGNEVNHSPVHVQSISEPLSLMKSLHQGIENGQLFLVYQPKLDLRTKRVTGVEALVRWRHPKLGIVLPEQFIPFAEKADLMKPLTLFVLKEAVNQCRLWHESGRKISVAMNLVRQSLLDSDLPDQICKLLEVCGVDPAWLDVEITESIIMSEPKNRVRKLSLRTK
ncbi:MAG: diguanylate cyclase [Nitrospirae bacterium]|nr:diguanylate cyclase [Nitrospirota bacterium]